MYEKGEGLIHDVKWENNFNLDKSFRGESNKFDDGILSIHIRTCVCVCVYTYINSCMMIAGEKFLTK